MPDTARIEELLAALLDNGGSPEAICAAHPALLGVVQARWEQLQRVSMQVEALFPTTPSERVDPTCVGPMPQIPGYDVQAVLGRGGMGIVYRAKHLLLNRNVALKMLLAGAYALRTERLRFVREAEAVATLQHPNIVQIFEVGETQGLPFFTMELVDGGTLAQRIAAQSLPIRAAAELVATIAEAMHTAHVSGIIHRDLKPANILLTREGLPKITDFGLARRLVDATAFTADGQALGTPSYMAPEQARGHSQYLGPAVDIYACGAILYELLTGRPPFQAGTNLATAQQVLTEEAVPPSRWAPSVPRDLETICLQCLHKQPAHRYESAAALAADLRRYLAGHPVHARPLGTIARSVKWARRRPTAALFLTTLVSLSIATIGVGLWLQQQEKDRQWVQQQREDQARRTLETALQRTADFCREERWSEALLVLQEAGGHLNHVHAPDFAERIQQAHQDCQTALALEQARERAPLLDTGLIDYPQKTREYEAVFASLGLATASEAEIHAHWQHSAIRPQLVAACDDWAYAAYRSEDYAQCDRLLRLARAADPEPQWRDQIRDHTTWNQAEKLRALASAAFTTIPEPADHHIAILNLLLQHNNRGPQGTQLLAHACQRRPGNYWLNREMGNALYQQNRQLEAIGYYRAALAARPNNARAHQSLGATLFKCGLIEPALAAYRRAVELAPSNRSLRSDDVEKLASAGYWKEAAEACAQALRDDPMNSTAPLRLASSYSDAQRIDEAIAAYRQAIAADANDSIAYQMLGTMYISLGRYTEAIPPLQRLTQQLPHNSSAAQLHAYALARVHRFADAEREYLRAIHGAPKTFWYAQEMAEVFRQQGRLKEAGAVFRQAIEQGQTFMSVWDQYALVLLDQGDFNRAAAATKKALEALAATESPAALQRRLALCTRLHAVQAQVPAYLAGTEKPQETATQLALAEWCQHHQHDHARAVELYELAFTADPALAADSANGHRFQALCAVGRALASNGRDAASLSEGRRATLRKQALKWLTAEYEMWHRKHGHAQHGARTHAASHVRGWLQHPHLQSLRDLQRQTALTADERRGWQDLWAAIATLADRDPEWQFARAREHNGAGQWPQALTCYAAGLALEPSPSADIWYEYAATQLLAGDSAAYRRTCAQLVARSEREPHLRRYLIARLCTLGATEDVVATAATLANDELQGNASAYWALTQQAALQIRTQSPQKAAPLLEQSLLADGRPGRAVVSQLWLALAHHRLGNRDEARRWRTQAERWLTQQTCQMQRENKTSGTHLHNWLEAQILLRECTTQLR